MKKKLGDSLKASLNQEREAVKKKDFNMDDRFAKAEEVFDKKAENSINENTLKIEKNKVIRDTFSMPEQDYSLIEKCKERALHERYSISKSEVIRAGLRVLNNLSNEKFIEALKTVEKVKTGRPKP